MKDNRRDFIKKGTALAALSLSGIGSSTANMINLAASKDILSEGSSRFLLKESGMKIALQASCEPGENDIKFIQQMGLNQVVLWTDASKSGYEYYASRRQLYEAAGIKVFGFGNSSVHNQDAIVLNLPGRDTKIEEYKTHLRNLGKAGIKYTTYAHMGNGIWSTERELTRGEASARALEIADSPNVGICLCVGCWLEGGTLMGKDVIETIRYFGKRKKIFKVHLRNVNQPLPYFVETFLDNGYADMYKIMKALKAVDFDGALIADHIPSMVYGSQTGTAFSIGYMKGLLERVNAEG